MTCPSSCAPCQTSSAAGGWNTHDTYDSARLRTAPYSSAPTRPLPLVSDTCSYRDSGVVEPRHTAAPPSHHGRSRVPAWVAGASRAATTWVNEHKENKTHGRGRI